MTNPLKNSSEEMVLDKLTDYSANKVIPLKKNLFSQMLLKSRNELIILVMLVLLFVTLQMITGTALSTPNLNNVLQVASPIFLIAIGQLIVMWSIYTYLNRKIKSRTRPKTDR